MGRCINCQEQLEKRVPVYDGQKNGQRHSLYECQKCKLVQLYPQPMMHRYSLVINDQQRLANPQLRVVYRFKFLAKLLEVYRKNIYANRKNTVMKFQKKGRLSDVGCGVGEFVERFDTRDWKVTGLEVEKGLAEHAKVLVPEGKFEVSRIENYRSKERFEVITLWHVFEHISDPRKAMDKIYRLMKPGGWLFIEVPNGDSLFRKLFGPYWQLYIVPQHLFLWNRMALTQFVGKSGFKVVEVDYLGLVSSATGSIGNYLRSKGFNTEIAILISFVMLPMTILTSLLAYTKRDNLLIVAKRKR